MTKYVVKYTLSYLHRVEVGIEADDPEKAVEQAEQLFDDGDIWDDTPACPLLFDDFEEDAGAGVPLTFEIEQTIADGDGFPEPDASVKQLRADANARSAASALIAAYRRGEANGGSIDWADLDAAYELALASQR